MWWSLFRGGQWSEFADFASPALFDLIGVADVMAELKSLASGYWDRQRWSAARLERMQALEETDIRVRFDSSRRGSFTGADDGEEILALYFHQLFVGGSTVLDLRRSCFRANGRLSWDPAPLCITWDEGFLVGLRDIYSGFYDRDDSRYKIGLEALGVGSADDLFFEHFGTSREGGLTSFGLADFRHTMHRIFLRCRDTRAHLHPNFVGLGVYLACLYEHLDAIGGKYDVRAAYLRATRAAPAAPIAAKSESAPEPEQSAR